MAPVAGAGLAPHSLRLSVVLPCTLKCIFLCKRLRQFNLQAPLWLPVRDHTSPYQGPSISPQDPSMNSLF